MHTLHVTGFTFVVISIVHLAGGKITEGTVYSLGCSFFSFNIFYQVFFVKWSAFCITFWIWELILWSLYIYSGFWIPDNLSFHLLHLKFNCVRLQSMKKDLKLLHVYSKLIHGAVLSRLVKDFCLFLFWIPSISIFSLFQFLACLSLSIVSLILFYFLLILKKICGIIWGSWDWGKLKKTIQLSGIQNLLWKHLYSKG